MKQIEATPSKGAWQHPALPSLSQQLMFASKSRIKFLAEDIERHLQNGVDLRQVTSLTEYLEILANEETTGSSPDARLASDPASPGRLGPSTAQKRANTNEITP